MKRPVCTEQVEGVVKHFAQCSHTRWFSVEFNINLPFELVKLRLGKVVEPTDGPRLYDNLARGANGARLSNPIF